MKLKITLMLCLSIICLQQANAQCGGAQFEEKNGIAILEMESIVSGNWKKESTSGASAGKALVYRGGNSFGSPGVSTTTYKVKINSAGTYRFIWRNKIGIIASHNPATEHNDTWLKINGSNFYGKKGSSTVYPGGSGKSPVAAGATSGGWFKIYTNTINWSWSTQTSDHNPHAVYAKFNSAGIYTIKISGRSNGHIVDRMVLYKEGSYSASQAQSLSRAETDCSGGTTTTPPTTTTGTNTAPTVSITSPSSSQSYTAGSNINVGVSSNDSDGTIASHKLYVNGSLKDTDGANYSTYTLSNVQSGSYAIKVVVTDNDGATGTTTVNITVGGGTTTTPTTPTTENTAPTVSFTNITNGQSFTAGSNVSVKLSSSDSDGSVVKHRIYVNGSLKDTDGANYTPHLISNLQTGSYIIKATVTDNDGATTSANATITVGTTTTTPTTPTTGENGAPTVSITSISDGDQVSVGSTVAINLSANDSDGSIVKYQIYVDGSLKDTDGSNFTIYRIQNIAAGAHTIKAIVTDNDGTTASATVTITAGTVTTTPTANAVTLDLIKASTNQSILRITNGQTVSSSKTTGVNIRANAPTGTSSVKFIVSGAISKIKTENVAPYALYGDISGNYLAKTLGNGSYTIRAIAYAGSGASGTVLADTTISFTISGSSSASGKSAYIYPNPVLSNGEVSIKLPNGGAGNYSYFVNSSLGVQLDQGQFNANTSETDVNLTLPKVGSQGEGVYYLTIISNDSKQTIPLIRE